LNNLLNTYKSDIDTARKNVNVWLKRAEAITKFLNLLSAKLEDNNLTEDELKSTVEEFKQMLEDWKKERV
jgi:DNA-binding transcriptional regulator WhiA